MKVVKLLRRHKANNAGEVCGFPDAEADSLVATGAAVWPNSANASPATVNAPEPAPVHSAAAPVQPAAPMVTILPPGEVPPQPPATPAESQTEAQGAPQPPAAATASTEGGQPTALVTGYTAEQKQAARDLLAAVDDMQFMAWRSQVVKLTGLTALRDKTACTDALNAVINGPDAATETPAA